ncbi:outer membrane beta-barrel protein [Paraflavitalea soli]|nr:outer membrane beta-barrel protein [Paraflavitalea soli]
MKRIGLFYLLMIFAVIAHGQLQRDSIQHMRKGESNILGGLNIGAAAPTSFPNTIRKINGYWPRVSPSLGFEYIYYLPEKWGIGAAFKLDFKGMGTRSEVIYFHTIIAVKDGDQTNEFTGTFSGKNETRVSNAYISVPIYAVYRFNNQWRAKLGFYMAWLFSSDFEGNVSDGYIRNGGPTGEKVNIDFATFDFGEDVNSFDIGLYGAGEYRISHKLSLSAQLSWGLRPIFPSTFKGMDFPLYNIFATLGVTYHL